MLPRATADSLCSVCGAGDDGTLAVSKPYVSTGPFPPTPPPPPMLPPLPPVSPPAPPATPPVPPHVPPVPLLPTLADLPDLDSQLADGASQALAAGGDDPETLAANKSAAAAIWTALAIVWAVIGLSLVALLVRYVRNRRAKPEPTYPSSSGEDAEQGSPGRGFLPSLMSGDGRFGVRRVKPKASAARLLIAY